MAGKPRGQPTPFPPNCGSKVLLTCRWCLQLRDGRAGDWCGRTRAPGPRGPLVAFEIEFIRMVLDYLGIAVKNSQLYGEMKETKSYLENLIKDAGAGIITVNTAETITSWKHRGPPLSLPARGASWPQYP